MKLTAQLQLQPTPEQAHFLRQTLEAANAACNVISAYAYTHQVFSKYDLQKAMYAQVREQFKLGAQVVIRCLGKVADAYKLERDVQRTFQAQGAVAYDARNLRYYTDKQQVSIWSVARRLTIPYVCGGHQAELLKYQKGESDLVYHREKWYLLATCDVPEPTPEQIDGWLGVDRGIINLAVDSEGNSYQGQRVDAKRRKYATQRQQLQQVGTKSAKRKLKKMRDKQARFQKDVNHCIAKELVLRAKHTQQGIAVEDLTGITLRTRVRREDRARHGNWGFDQLGQFIEYKARLYGVPYIAVDPRYTSQRCAACGHTDKANRISQAHFACRSCGHTAHADVNAAVNISVKAARHAASGLGGVSALPDTPRPGTSPAL
jgi:putative transposase